MTTKTSLLLALAFTLLTPSLPAQGSLQRLLSIWNDASQPDTTRFGAMDSIVRKVYQNQPDSALYYAEIQHHWAVARKNPVWMGLSMQRQAEATAALGDNARAAEKFEQALKWLRPSAQKKEVASAVISLGMVYRTQGDFVKAQEWVLEGLNLSEAAGDKKGQANALYALSVIYLDEGDLETALKYAQQGLLLREEINDQPGLTGDLANMGIILADVGQYEQALTYTLRAADLSTSLNDLNMLAATCDNLGFLYERMDKPEQVLPQYLRALEIRQQTGERQGMSYTLSLIGSWYAKRKNYPLAISYFKQALSVAQEMNNLSSIWGFSYNLYLAYKESGQYEASLEMHELYMQVKDSIYNEENTKTLLKQQFEYEQDKKDALAQKELTLRNLQRNASLGGLGLVAILAGVLFVNGRRRRKTNELLSAQKSEIETKSNQNEVLLKEIHHRVKNNLQTISSLLHLQSAHIKDEDVKQAVAAGQHRVESMALIHQKLYQRDNLAAIEMKDYLSNLVTSLIETFDADPERIRFHLDMPKLEMDVDTAVPLGLIVNELITNSLKYAFPGGRAGTITVSLRKTDNLLDLLVADDGVGSANTATGTAFGSQLVKLLAAQLGGRITQEVTNGYATRIII
ncbi:MAG: histidine kinase dimerization/phosphoacceptor domain -containing protein [Bacteroidia bacterium]|nr:histidine kinase dimerization/phosphoacceptor domain -containing protein [Bacteroidia bacterium]